MKLSYFFWNIQISFSIYIMTLMIIDGRRSGQHRKKWTNNVHNTKNNKTGNWNKHIVTLSLFLENSVSVRVEYISVCAEWFQICFLKGMETRTTHKPVQFRQHTFVQCWIRQTFCWTLRGRNLPYHEFLYCPRVAYTSCLIPTERIYRRTIVSV